LSARILDQVRRLAPLRGYAAALAAVALVTVVIGAIEARAHAANISMLYLIAVLGAAILLGRGPAIVASIASFLAFNWFFVEPYHTLTVGDPKEWFALVLFLFTAVITSQLAADQRDRAREAADRAREATLMFEVARVLGEPDLDRALAAVTERLHQGLGVAGVIVELEGEGAPRRTIAGDTSVLGGANVGTLAAWIPSSRSATGAGARWIRVMSPRSSSTAPRDERVHAVPLQAGGQRIGTLAIVRASPRPRSADDRILTSVATQLAGAIERSGLRQRATEAEILRRADELKNALLGAVSHDLRTPLASIVASAGSLRQTDVRWTDAERESFLSDIEHEARRLSRIVSNLLDLSRMESGTLHPERSWYDLAALIDDVVGRLRPLTQDHRVEVRVPEDLPPISLDYVEIDQVLTNLIENAARHTRPGAAIVISAAIDGGEAVVEVSDDGPGLPKEATDRVFEAFFRGPSRGTPRGTGLGLAVARGLVEAHGGHISARNRPEGGAVFRFTLPIEQPTRMRTHAVS
jgi:two-component system, OmpR family, sensor histidine kinase KdpD